MRKLKRAIVVDKPLKGCIVKNKGYAKIAADCAGDY